MTSTKDVAAMPAGTTPPASPRVPAPRQRRRRKGLGESVVPYLLLAPGVIAIAALLLWPTFQLVLISFRKLDLRELVTGQLVWVGFDNFASVLADPQFWEITLRTLVFTASVVAGTLVIGMLVALLMKHINPVIRVILQVTLVLAWAVPVIAATTIFQWIFDQQYGILNKTLDRLGFDGFIGYSWFSSGTSTMTVIGILIVWQAVPFVAFSLYAGLIGVPREQYEAAGIDGASGPQTFRAVTWPALKPILTIVTFLSVIWDFQVFAQVWAVKQGGPDGQSTTLPILMYLKGIASSKFGPAAAVSMLMLVILIALTARYIQILVRSKEVELK
ncbi:N,N'-diacetylchitobiose transport system permease protein [Kibdelosporangium banguiense]|uniref:N,N'-diacetylchitobiose transport system permease protein n=1 Tax=Kibdelosporangium banguiense TaxID=1365924 RepID=A0ABS4TJA8_9PSEU|nr:sugar ABC transporter permease [Kibdelosporangium banguiense]MBP2324511.1 N,N'-diacetylchitobiose transport system permease protein [Kibdelosporangium banguiense]